MKKGHYWKTSVEDIIQELDRRPDTYVNFTLLIILQERTFTLDEQIVLLSYLFNQYRHLTRSLINYRPDCSEASCTGEIFVILDTWETAWLHVIHNGICSYSGYSEYLASIQVLYR